MSDDFAAAVAMARMWLAARYGGWLELRTFGQLNLHARIFLCKQNSLNMRYGNLLMFRDHDQFMSNVMTEARRMAKHYRIDEVGE